MFEDGNRSEAHRDVRLTDLERRQLALWIDLLIPFVGCYLERHAWSPRQQATYAYYQMKRDVMEEIEWENIRMMMAWQAGEIGLPPLEAFPQFNRGGVDYKQAFITAWLREYRENHGGVWVTASFHNPNDSLEAVIDGREPRNSGDHNIPRMTFWDRRGTAEWIELDFGQTKEVSQTSVYWFDDTARRGGCRVPQSWTLSYRNGDQWVPVRTTGTFGVERDQYNTILFEPIETTGLRLNVQMQPGYSTGILDWRYE